MAEANRPSTMVLAIVCFSDGHTGRLPTIDTPQSHPVTKGPSQVKYCWKIEPVSPFFSLNCWLTRRRVMCELARGIGLPRDRYRPGWRRTPGR